MSFLASSILTASAKLIGGDGPRLHPSGLLQLVVRRKRGERTQGNEERLNFHPPFLEVIADETQLGLFKGTLPLHWNTNQGV